MVTGKGCLWRTENKVNFGFYNPKFTLEYAAEMLLGPQRRCDVEVIMKRTGPSNTDSQKAYLFGHLIPLCQTVLCGYGNDAETKDKAYAMMKEILAWGGSLSTSSSKDVGLFINKVYIWLIEQNCQPMLPEEYKHG